MRPTATRDTGRDRLARVGVAPRGLDRIEAAAYIGVSPQTLDRLVADGRMPRAREIGGRHVWDRHQLDRAFDDLPHVAGRDGHPTTVDEPDDVFSRARA